MPKRFQLQQAYIYCMLLVTHWSYDQGSKRGKEDTRFDRVIPFLTVGIHSRTEWSKHISGRH